MIFKNVFSVLEFLVFHLNMSSEISTLFARKNKNINYLSSADLIMKTLTGIKVI